MGYRINGADYRFIFVFMETATTIHLTVPRFPEALDLDILILMGQMLYAR
ncbi:MAG TPA: hypothetical protein VN456_15305 [Desulfosporosinus sp.]|nr:hypothetical protein [Desulfosporosinus sp.]